MGSLLTGSKQKLGFNDLSFVACLESGPLEEMTVRLVASLRRFGGGAAEAPIYCVCPRFGPALSRRTRAELRRLDAELIHCRPTNRYPWYHYLNKWLAAQVAEERAGTPGLVFLDSDVLVLGEPSEFCLDETTDFAGMLEIYSRANQTIMAADDEFWDAMTAAVGVRLQDVPFIPVASGGSTRMYWNGGVAAFRRGMGLPAQVIEDVHTVLDRHIANHGDHLHFIEQRMVGVSVLKRSMRWRELTLSHNTNIEAWKRTAPPMEKLRETRILHYHNAMDDIGWEWLLDLLKESHHHVHGWLAAGYGPVRDNRLLHRRVIGEGLRVLRSRRRQSHIARCTHYGPSTPNGANQN